MINIEVNNKASSDDKYMKRDIDQSINPQTEEITQY